MVPILAAETLDTTDQHPDGNGLVLTNQLDELERLSDWLGQQIAPLGHSAEFLYRVELVLVEAISNIILYAYEDEEQHLIAVKLLADDQTLIITIVDDGEPFNPLEDHAVILPTSLEESSIGGFGIHLMKSYANHCSYERREDKNALTLAFRARSEAPGRIA
jgi:anti-sigma regulatory factor (Ser/Thr protein kinase)